MPRIKIADLAKIIRSQVHVGSADILLEAMELGRAGDRHDPRLLS